MNGNGSDQEKDFFVTGAKTYLDVDAAMVEFRRQVQDLCMNVAIDRLHEINRASGMDWTRNDLKDYRETDLNCVYLGKQVQVEDFGTLFFYLTLSRERDRGPYAASVCLYRQSSKLAVNLWARLSGISSDTADSKGNSLVFTRRIPENELHQFREHLAQAVDDFVTFVSASGGLAKRRAQRSQQSESDSEAEGTVRT
jgi:hypothetical protein